MTKKERYVKKVIKEFTDKGWDTSKLMGRMKYDNVITSDTHYEKFKQNVKKERQYNRERQVVKKEYKQIKKKFEKNVEARNQKLYEDLRKQGLSAREARQVVMEKIQKGLPRGYVLDRDLRGKVFTNKLIESLTNELEIKRKGGRLKTIKGPLSRFYGERYLQDKFKILEEMSSRDNQALRHMNILLDKFMGKIIPQAYGDRKGTSVQFKSPTSEFYIDLMDKLIHEYKVILKE